MVVGIGGGTTEVAILSMGGIVASTSLRVAGNRLDEAVLHYMRRAHSLLVGERTAEQIKITIGSATPTRDELQMEVRGRDLVSGLPRTVAVSSVEIREALSEPVAEIVAAVRSTLERTPPELAADLAERGIVLTGGGALLRGLDRLIAAETGMPVTIADDPLRCVVRGAGMMLDELDRLRKKAL